MEQMQIQPEDWKEDYKEFDEATEKFYKGEVDAKTYKGISGGFGSYAQRGGHGKKDAAQADNSRRVGIQPNY